MNASEDIDFAIAALQAVKLVRATYASGPEGSKRVADIAEMLAMGEKPIGQFGGIRRTVADAISKAYLNQPLPD